MAIIHHKQTGKYVDSPTIEINDDELEVYHNLYDWIPTIKIKFDWIEVDYRHMKIIGGDYEIKQVFEKVKRKRFVMSNLRQITDFRTVKLSISQEVKNS